MLIFEVIEKGCNTTRANCRLLKIPLNYIRMDPFIQVTCQKVEKELLEAFTLGVSEGNKGEF